MKKPVRRHVREVPERTDEEQVAPGPFGLSTEGFAGWRLPKPASLRVICSAAEVAWRISSAALRAGE